MYGGLATAALFNQAHCTFVRPGFHAQSGERCQQARVMQGFSFLADAHAFAALQLPSETGFVGLCATFEAELHQAELMMFGEFSQCAFGLAFGTEQAIDAIGAAEICITRIAELRRCMNARIILESPGAQTTLTSQFAVVNGLQGFHQLCLEQQCTDFTHGFAPFDAMQLL